MRQHKSTDGEDLQAPAAVRCLAQMAALTGEPCGLLPAPHFLANAEAHDRLIKVSCLAS